MCRLILQILSACLVFKFQRLSLTLTLSTFALNLECFECVQTTLVSSRKVALFHCLRPVSSRIKRTISRCIPKSYTHTHTWCEKRWEMAKNRLIYALPVATFDFPGNGRFSTLKLQPLEPILKHFSVILIFLSTFPIHIALLLYLFPHPTWFSRNACTHLTEKCSI